MNLDGGEGEADSEIPVVYVACPLTGVSGILRRTIGAQLGIIKNAITCVTDQDRADGEEWPVSVYVPFDHTAPWTTDQLTAKEVYQCNLSQVHGSDALIVLGENGASAGVGQELEWALRLGLPVLYLSPEGTSRQIEGTPGVTSVAYNDDVETLEVATRNFMRRMRPLIEAGPRRRRSRSLRFEALRLRLFAAWEACADRTEAAASCGLSFESLELLFHDSTILAMQSVDTVVALAGALKVSLEPFVADVVLLPAAAMRALVTAGEENAWSDDLVERLAIYGIASLAESSEIDLATVTAWTDLRKSIGATGTEA
jgi:hypothetical protein